MVGRLLIVTWAFLALSVFALGCGGGDPSSNGSSSMTAQQSSSGSETTVANTEGGDLRPGYTEETVTCPVSIEEASRIVGRPLESNPAGANASCGYVNEGGIHNNVEFTVTFEHADGNVLKSYWEADEALIEEVPNCSLDSDPSAGSDGYEGLCSGETPSAGMTFVTPEPEQTWKVQLLYWAESDNPVPAPRLSQMLHELLFTES